LIADCRKKHWLLKYFDIQYIHALKAEITRNGVGARKISAIVILNLTRCSLKSDRVQTVTPANPAYVSAQKNVVPPLATGIGSEELFYGNSQEFPQILSTFSPGFLKNW